MPQTRPNLIKVPVNSDAYNLTGDLTTMADSVNAIIPVANAAARDALTKFVGLTVSRQDLGMVLETWDGLAWQSTATHFNVPGVTGLPIIYGSEVAVTIGTSSVGIINFPAPFPNTFRSVVITDSTGAANGIVVKFRSDLSTASYAKFTAFDNTTGNGIANGTVMYVNYIAMGY